MIKYNSKKVNTIKYATSSAVKNVQEVLGKEGSTVKVYWYKLGD